MKGAGLFGFLDDGDLGRVRRSIFVLSALAVSTFWLKPSIEIKKFSLFEFHVTPTIGADGLHFALLVMTVYFGIRYISLSSIFDQGGISDTLMRDYLSALGKLEESFERISKSISESVDAIQSLGSIAYRDDEITMAIDRVYEAISDKEYTESSRVREKELDALRKKINEFKGLIETQAQEGAFEKLKQDIESQMEGRQILVETDLESGLQSARDATGNLTRLIEERIKAGGFAVDHLKSLLSQGQQGFGALSEAREVHRRLSIALRERKKDNWVTKLVTYTLLATSVGASLSGAYGFVVSLVA